MVVEAGIAVRRDDAVFSAAASASQKPGKKMNRPIRQMHAPHSAFQRVGWVRADERRDVRPTGSGGIPEFFVNDPEMWNFRPDPLAFRIDP
jgi:hypothetical protein